MRHAVAVLVLLAAMPLAALAAKPEGPTEGIGMIAYSAGPRFKVGDWVRYHTTGSSYQGYKTDYVVTMIVAGEELWWGEECFWIETHTSYSGGPPEVTASLMSYSVFEDTLPSRHFQKYIRKYFDGIDDQGRGIQQPFLRALAELTTRGFEYTEPDKQRDTVGFEKLETVKGMMDALHDIERMREATSVQDGDSTFFYEVAEEHQRWWSDAVPITRLARIKQNNVQRKRAWVAGESESAPLQIIEQTIGGSELVDFGTGMKATLVPERFQRPLAEQRVQRPKRPVAPAPKGRASSG